VVLLQLVLLVLWLLVQHLLQVLVLEHRPLE
jgi:hypothetical protein